MTTKKTTPVAPVHEIVHTPGPWNYHDSGSIVMTADGQMSVADIRGFGRLEKDFGLSAAIKIMDKNGKLIAAAPSLLAACRELLEAMDEYEWSVDDAPTPQHREMMLRAMKAVEDAS